MVDFFDEVREELRNEKIAQFFKRYGTLIGAAILILIVSVAANSWYQSYSSNKQAEYGTALLDAILLEQNEETEKAISSLNMLIAKADGDIRYFAMLHKANILAEKGNKEEAIKLYKDISSNSDADITLRDLSTLQLYSLSNGKKGIDISNLSKNTRPFNVTAAELQAGNMIKSNPKKAIELYESILFMENASQETKQRVQTILKTLQN